MYTYDMAQVTIYLSDELRGLVKAADLPVSEICQQALRVELARKRRRSQYHQRVARRGGNIN